MRLGEVTGGEHKPREEWRRKLESWTLQHVEFQQRNQGWEKTGRVCYCESQGKKVESSASPCCSNLIR